MDPDKVKLLFGPYKTPAVRLRDRVFCLYRDAEVVIYGWSNARIPWPLCHAVGAHCEGRGILIEEELARAIQHESSTAIQYWWGASRSAVRWWRRTLGVGRMDAEGSRRLIHGAVLKGLKVRHNLPDSAHLWTAEEMALLGKVPDSLVAYWTGRTANAVALMRKQLGIAAVRERHQEST